MKLYNPQPDLIIRLQITRHPEPYEYINLCDCSALEVEKYLKKLITNQKISPFVKGNKTSIVIRECIGSKNGKSKSISFRGLSAKQTHDLITKNMMNDS